MSQDSSVAQTASSQNSEDETEDLQGLGGWLALVGLGVVISPLLIIINMVRLFSGVFTSGAWPLLITPGTSVYSPLWKPIILSELLANFAMAMVAIFVMVLFFSKKKLFPKLYVGLVVFTLVFILVDAAAATLVLPDQPMLDTDTIQRFLRSAARAVIWVPYMFLSKRVRATFVN